MRCYERSSLRVAAVFCTTAAALLGCGGGGSGGGSAFVGTIYYQVAAGDLDGDGLTDLAAIAEVYDAAGVSVELQVLLQDRANVGHFSIEQRLPLSTAGGAVAVGDLDGDNRVDIVVTEPGRGNDRVRVFLQDAGPGRFTLADTRPTPGGLTRVAIADIDQDGHPDIVLAVGAGVVALRQDATALGTFPSQSIIDMSENVDTALVVQYQTLAVGDLNGDGRTDVATVRGNGNVHIYFQSSTTAGTFTPVNLGMSLPEPTALAVGAIDDDGFDDVAATGYTDVGKPVGRVRLQNPAQPGAFLDLAHVSISDVGDPRALAIADVTGDGLPDLVFGKSHIDYGFIEVWEQTGPPFAIQRIGVFPDIKLAHNPGNLSSMVVADLNDDGLPDVAIVDGELSCLFNVPADPGQFLAAVRAVR